jgi:hypothetical protein
MFLLMSDVSLGQAFLLASNLVAVFLFYGGPDTILPIASSLAAIGGLLLILWSHLVRYVRAFIQQFRRRGRQFSKHKPSNSNLSSSG